VSDAARDGATAHYIALSDRTGIPYRHLNHVISVPFNAAQLDCAIAALTDAMPDGVLYQDIGGERADWAGPLRATLRILRSRYAPDATWEEG